MRRLAALLLLPVACDATALGTHEHAPRLRSDLEPFGLTVEPANTAVTQLGYQPPSAECAQVYRIDIGYAPQLAQEEPSTSWLTVGHHPDGKKLQPDAGAPIPDGATFEGRLHYQGIRVADPGVSRDLYLSALHAGPASPTAGCLGQTWDPIEDALTLGWPKLTGRLTAVDDAWPGLRVEGKCNKSACVDPSTGRGGADNPKRTCVTDSWRTELAGLFDVRGERFALVRSTWTDGHGPPDVSNKLGIWTERAVLVSVEHGRPTWARTVVHYNFPQQLKEGSWGPVTRTWEMTSTDECPGSLAALGWTRPASDVVGADQGQAALASSDELRKGSRRSKMETPSE